MTDACYQLGEALAYLAQASEKQASEKQASEPELSYSLTGKLYKSRSGWILMSVPNALGRGAFDALNEPGVELPLSETSGQYNAHVSVMSPSDLEKIPGGAEAVSERGHEFSYTLGPLRSVAPDNWAGVSRVWYLTIRSPALKSLRRSYGLPELPHGDRDFHITIAIRQSNVLHSNDVSKRATAETRPDYDTGIQHLEVDEDSLSQSKQSGVQELRGPRNYDLPQMAAISVILPGHGSSARPGIHVGAQEKLAGLQPRQLRMGDETGTGAQYTRERANSLCREKLGISGPGNRFWNIRGIITAAVADGLADRDGGANTAGKTASERDLAGARRRDYERNRLGTVGEHVGSDTVSTPDSRVVIAGGVKYADLQETLSTDVDISGGDAHVAGMGAQDRLLDRDAERAIANGLVRRGDANHAPACGEIHNALGKIGASPYIDDGGGKTLADQSAGYCLSEPAQNSVALAKSKTASDISRANADGGGMVAGEENTSDDAVRQVTPWVERGGYIEYPSRRATVKPASVSLIHQPTDWAKRLTQMQERTGQGARTCPGCGDPFKEDEPYPDVEMCEVCERFGPPKKEKSAAALSTMGPGGCVQTKSPMATPDGALPYMTQVGSQNGSAPEKIAFPTTNTTNRDRIGENSAGKRASVVDDVDAAGAQCEEPKSEEQARAGNYRHGHCKLHGMDITIETGKGMTRKGTDKSGKPWSITLQAHYGYIKRTESEADGDHMDVFIGPDPESEVVFIVDQEVDGKFDEAKCMLGFKTKADAEAGYLANYAKGWKGLGSITSLTIPQFKEWVMEGDTSKPLAGQKLTFKQKAAALRPGVQLQPQQARIADQASHEPVRKLLFHSLGSGKTLAAIAAAEASGQPYNAVVPASLRSNFRKEQEKFTDEETPSDVQSYTSLAKGMPQDPGGTVIYDEAHRLRNPEAKQTQQAKALAAQARNVILLSGSPVVNHPSDLAPLIEMLTRKNMSPAQFDAKFVGDKTTWPGLGGWFAGVKPVKEPALRNREELKQLLTGHVDYHKPANTGVEQLDEHYSVPMSGEQVSLHQAFWDQLPTILRWKLQNSFPLTKQEIGNLSSFMSGPRQVGLSTLPFMRGKRDPMAAFKQSPKLQKAMSMLEEAFGQDPESKGVVYSNFIDAGLEPYAAALAAKKIPHAMFHGGLNDAARKQVVADYNAGKIRALLLGPSGSEGISLRGTKLLQILDPHWNETRIDQAIGRGIRFDSHTHLPPEQRKVRVQRFTSELPAGMLSRLWRRLIQTRPSTDANDPGTDTYLERMSTRKEQLNDQFLDVLREVGTPKAAAVSVLPQLRQAKAHSDARRYNEKAMILRQLIYGAPQDWSVDQPDPRFPGITHTPTNFRFHLPRAMLPTSLTNSGSHYLDAAVEEPIELDPQAGVVGNVSRQFSRIRGRGDRKIRELGNQEALANAADPSRSLRQLRATTSGKQKPIVSHPLDLALHG